MLEDAPEARRRDITDRRRRPTGPLDAFPRGGRRKQVRRAEERQGVYFVDRFDNLTFLLILGLIGLSLLDGVLTMQLLRVHSDELNPLMRYFLTRGPTAFFVVKYVLTVAGIPFLLVYKNYPLFGTRFRVGQLFWFFLVGYVALLVYELYLLELDRTMSSNGAATTLAPPLRPSDVRPLRTHGAPS